MARKSRKNLPQPEQAVISVQFPELDEGKIPTAIYGRLSVEDNEDNESMETQIALVQPSLQGMILKRCRIFWRRIRKYSKQ